MQEAAPTREAAQSTEADPIPEERPKASGAAKKEEQEESSKEGDERPLPPEVERPYFMRNKPFIPDFLLREKREKINVAGAPVVGWDQEDGALIGGMLEVSNLGRRDDPFYRTAPYRWNASIGGSLATAGVHDYFVNLDVPYIANSPWRIRTGGAVRVIPNINYFGIGSETMDGLRLPGDPKLYTKYGEYDEAAKKVEDGATNANYSKLSESTVETYFFAERDLFGGVVRPIVGAFVGHRWVHDYTGQKVQGKNEKGEDVEGTQGTTKFKEDLDSGAVTGAGNSFYNFVKLGVSFDTRDFEPDPNKGLRAQFSTDWYSRAFGNKTEYANMALTTSGYAPLLPGITRLIFAARAVYKVTVGDAPYYAYREAPANGIPVTAVGGYYSMRGVVTRRYVGKSALMLGGELRWSVIDFHLGSHHFRPMLVGFVDAGRVYDKMQLTFDKMGVSGGGGARIAWNLAVILGADYAVSKEHQVFYFSLGHPF